VAGADGLSRIQRRALVALMASRTVAEAAEASGVSTRTLERWLADPGFAAAYRSTARDASRQALSALLSAQLEAVAALRDALQAESPATQVRAARALLEVGVRARESDLDERINAVEEEVTRWRTGVAPVWRGWSA